MLEKAAPESITSSGSSGDGEWEAAILQALQKAEAKVQEQLEANKKEEQEDAPSPGSAGGGPAAEESANKKRKTEESANKKSVEDIGVARISASMAV